MLTPLVPGKDPLDIEGVSQSLAYTIMFDGFAGAEMRALSVVTFKPEALTRSDLDCIVALYIGFQPHTTRHHN